MRSLGLSHSHDIGIYLTHVCNSWDCRDQDLLRLAGDVGSLGRLEVSHSCRASTSGLPGAWVRRPSGVPASLVDSAGAMASPCDWPGVWTPPRGTPRVPASPAGSKGALASPSAVACQGSQRLLQGIQEPGRLLAAHQDRQHLYCLHSSSSSSSSYFLTISSCWRKTLDDVCKRISFQWRRPGIIMEWKKRQLI